MFGHSDNELLPANSSSLNTSLDRLTPATRRQTGREVERVVARTLIAEAKEQGRAVLANSALNNVGALTALEQHLIQVAPLGEARYKHIVDSYALGAATTIANWR